MRNLVAVNVAKIQYNPVIRIFIFVLFVTARSTAICQQTDTIPAYRPESKELYDIIAQMDSLWQDSYNNCKLDKQAEIISDSIEFYHDHGGLSTSKTALIEALKNNICGKVTRELLKSSLEVYIIKNYGAVEMGYHRFKNVKEERPSRYSKFVHVWRNENGKWRITRVISLH